MELFKESVSGAGFPPSAAVEIQLFLKVPAQAGKVSP